jgi:hypothetical protein
MDRPEHLVDNGLRLSFLLGRLAPAPFASLFNPNLNETRFEQLAEGGAPQATAIALFGDDVSFELARDPFQATVCARVWVRGISGEALRKDGSQSAIALNQAWIDFLIRWVCRGSDQPGNDNQSPA